MIEISPVLTKDNSVIHLNPRDNVAIARVALTPGRVVSAGGVDVTLTDPVPAGHKVALAPLEASAVILRYGQPIGRAACCIQPGQHVHLHNLKYDEPSPVYEFPEGTLQASAVPEGGPVFLGYPRADGRAGTRNYIAVVAASNCSAHTVQLVARSFEGQKMPPNVDGVVAFPHDHGCGGVVGRDKELLHRTIAGVMNHPNVFASVLIGLGCETNEVSHFVDRDTPPGSRLVGLTLQSSGGTPGTVEAAHRQIERFIEEASAERRVELPLSKLVLGLNCGGSDSFSGITANPALGVCSELLTAAGGTAVLAETPEIYGAEHLLVKRAASRAVAERLLGFIEGYKTYVGCLGGKLDDNPAAGNKAGGLSNIVEKSLGAVAKGGDCTLMDAVDYSERITSPGLVFMNTPGYDPPSLAGLAAGGVNVIVFTSGRGSAIGFPTIPVIKVATNSSTYRAMKENIDINAGTVADGVHSLAEVGREIFDALLRVASGERTWSERWGHAEFVPWRLGPVL